jgi:hypothetical protein
MEWAARSCLLLMMVALVGCKAMPAPPAGFIDSRVPMAQRADLPFDKVWVRPGVSLQGYDKIAIAPIDTRYLMQQTWWKQMVNNQTIQRDARNLANYFHRSLTGAFSSDPNNRLRVVRNPRGRGTLVLELAIVEVTPTKAVLNIASYAASFAGAAIRTQTSGTIAFEARIRDGSSGKILAQFADRESGQASLVNLKNFSWYGHAIDIIHMWSWQMVRSANKRPGEVVYDRSAFTLKPW